MAGWRQAIELAMGEAEFEALGSIARSRTAPARQVERARMLLAYQENPSFFAVGQALGVHHQTVQRCVERALPPELGTHATFAIMNTNVTARLGVVKK
jgi:hypothetical protein